MAKQKGLGRGLDALLGGGEMSAESAPTRLNVTQLQPGKYQPRSHMDQESLQHLADSIKAQGVMQPILVRKLDAERYEIIAGERRWRASRLAGLSEVPVLVREVPDEAALSMSLIENIQRENLNPLEEATGIQRLINEFSMTHLAAAAAVGRSRSAVSNLLRLLNLALPAQELLMENRIDMGHARALLALGHSKQAELAHQIVQKNLSVRDTEKWVQKILNPAQDKKPKPDQDVLRLQEDLAQRLGAQVLLRHGKNGRGKLVIGYDNLDQLASIMSKF